MMLVKWSSKPKACQKLAGGCSAAETTGLMEKRKRPGTGRRKIDGIISCTLSGCIYLNASSGGVASLNPRLISDNLSGCKNGTRLRRWKTFGGNGGGRGHWNGHGGLCNSRRQVVKAKFLPLMIIA
jgi:hypothetical protein